MDILPQRYKYHRLPPGHIRVLSTPHLIPGGQHQLAFSLRTIPLHDNLGIETIAYDALSYSWGLQTEPTHSLICGGYSIPIGPSLQSALPYLMRRPSKLPLWIDAVCINQSDEAEKVDQIRMQSKIYKRAMKVWIWLNPVPPGHVDAAKEAIQCISRIRAARIDVTLQGGRFGLDQLGLPRATSQTWSIIIEILKSRWFTRLWVIQECTLAKTPVFLFGDFVIKWNDLWETSRRIHSPRHLIDEHGGQVAADPDVGFSQTVFYCRDQYLNYPGDGFKHIGVLLPLTILQDCSHPKARVWALLGFLDDQLLSEISFDETTEESELFAEFFGFLLCKSTHLRALSFTLWFAIDSAGKSNRDIPSWCPDFDALHHTRRLLDTVPTIRNYRPSRKPMFTRRGLTPTEIVFRGCVFDSVKVVGRKLTTTRSNTTVETLNWWIEVQQWEDEAARFAYSEPAIKPYQYYRILFEYHIIGSVVSVTMGEYELLKAKLAELVTIVRQSTSNRCVEYLEQSEIQRTGDDRLMRLRDILNDLEEGHAGKEFRHALRNRSGYRALVTAKHVFGFVHGEEIGPRDGICLLNGAEVFYVIRKYRSDEPIRDLYRLVGDAWIYLHMNGEVEDRNLQEEEIVLV